MARRRSIFFLRWLGRQVEDACQTAQKFTALGGHHFTLAIRDELAATDPEQAGEVFYALANDRRDL